MQNASEKLGRISTPYSKGPNKIMVYVWWDYHSIIHFVFLYRNQGLNTGLYS